MRRRFLVHKRRRGPRGETLWKRMNCPSWHVTPPILYFLNKLNRLACQARDETFCRMNHRIVFWLIVKGCFWQRDVVTEKCSNFCAVCDRPWSSLALCQNEWVPSSGRNWPLKLRIDTLSSHTDWVLSSITGNARLPRQFCHFTMGHALNLFVCVCVCVYIYIF